MNPHYIIDGYNFIHKIPKFRQAIEQSLEHARAMIISFLRSYQSRRMVKITLVFDGDNVGYVEPPSRSIDKFKIVFSMSPEKADPLIQRLIKKQKNKKSVVLISADQELINFCQSQGASTMSPESFYEQISSYDLPDQLNQKYAQSLTPEEVSEWLKIFGEKK